MSTAETINALAVQERKQQPVSEPLYQVEEDLLALIDTEALVPEDKKAEFQAELYEQLRKAVQKRDRVGQFIRHCETLATASKEERKRLDEREKMYTKAADTLRDMVHNVIEAIGPKGYTKEGKPQWEKLEGNTVTFSLRNNPGSVKIVDEERIESKHKRITLTLPLDLWNEIAFFLEKEASPSRRDVDAQRIMDRLAGYTAKKPATIEVSKTSLKEAFEAGEFPNGADLENTTSLVLK